MILGNILVNIREELTGEYNKIVENYNVCPLVPGYDSLSSLYAYS
jgi:hypothetical protein